MRTILIIALVLGLAACVSSDGEQDEERLRIVATTTIMGDLARQVAGEHADVEVLMPAGADPHEFQPSARQTASLAEADLVVANGLGLEEGLGDKLQAVSDEGTPVFEVGPQVDPIPFHDGEGLDPHVWLDPIRMAEAARLLGDALVELDGRGPYLDLAEVYAEELERTDARIREMLDGVGPGRRKLVTNHDSLGYFAERYGFEVVGVVIPGGATLASPSSEDLARLVEVIREEDVSVVFAETTDSPALARSVAAEAGQDILVVELHTGSLGEGSAQTLIDLLIANAQSIAGALG